MLILERVQRLQKNCGLEISLQVIYLSWLFLVLKSRKLESFYTDRISVRHWDGKELHKGEKFPGIKIKCFTRFFNVRARSVIPKKKIKDLNLNVLTHLSVYDKKDSWLSFVLKSQKLESLYIDRIKVLPTGRQRV